MKYSNQARFLTSFREKHDLTQRNIAEASYGLTSQFVSRVENGHAPISVQIAAAMLKLVPGLSVKSLLDAIAEDFKNDYKRRLDECR